MILFIRADLPLEAIRNIPGSVRIVEPAVWVDDEDGSEYWASSDHRFTVEMVGRAAALGQGRPYSDPGPPTQAERDTEDFDPFKRAIEAQGQSGRRPVATAAMVRIGADGLHPRASEDDAE